jgi:hypothetical protein
MLALSGLREGFARGLVPLPTACPERGRRAPLFGRKHSSLKPRVSITYKLIQNKALQLHYFSHLRKTGGRGSYWFALSGSESPARRSFSEGGPLPPKLAQGFRLIAYDCLLTPFFPLHTRHSAASPMFPLHTQKQGGTPPQKCRRADIFDFSPYILHFSCPERGTKGGKQLTNPP